MIFILIAVGICVADLLIKYWVEKKRTFADKSSILGGNIVIEKSHNKGACLNFMDKRPNYVLGITGVIFFFSSKTQLGVSASMSKPLWVAPLSPRPF